MKKACMVVFLLICFNCSLAKPVGYWVTFDDDTKQPRSIIEITVDKKKHLSAYIRKVYPRPTDTGFCRMCPGHFKNQPIKNLRFVWGLKHMSHKHWDKGKILEPKKGHIYDCRITESSDPNQLIVRGYIKMPFLGQNKYWRRATPEEIATI